MFRETALLIFHQNCLFRQKKREKKLTIPDFNKNCKKQSLLNNKRSFKHGSNTDKKRVN